MTSTRSNPRFRFKESDWWCICHDSSIHLEKWCWLRSKTSDADQSIVCWCCQTCSATAEVLVSPFFTACWCFLILSTIVQADWPKHSPCKEFGRQFLCDAPLELGLLVWSKAFSESCLAWTSLWCPPPLISFLWVLVRMVVWLLLSVLSLVHLALKICYFVAHGWNTEDIRLSLASWRGAILRPRAAASWTWVGTRKQGCYHTSFVLQWVLGEVQVAICVSWLTVNWHMYESIWLEVQQDIQVQKWVFFHLQHELDICSLHSSDCGMVWPDERESLCTCRLPNIPKNLGLEKRWLSIFFHH